MGGCTRVMGGGTRRGGVLAPWPPSESCHHRVHYCRYHHPVYTTVGTTTTGSGYGYSHTQPGPGTGAVIHSRTRVTTAGTTSTTAGTTTSTTAGTTIQQNSVKSVILSEIQQNSANFSKICNILRNSANSTPLTHKLDTVNIKDTLSH